MRDRDSDWDDMAKDLERGLRAMLRRPLVVTALVAQVALVALVVVCILFAVGG